MWVKTALGDLLNLNHVRAFEVVYGSSGYEIQARMGGGTGGLPVGTGYSSEAAAKDALAAFLVIDLSA